MGGVIPVPLTARKAPQPFTGCKRAVAEYVAACAIRVELLFEVVFKRLYSRFRRKYKHLKNNNKIYVTIFNAVCFCSLFLELPMLWE